MDFFSDDGEHAQAYNQVQNEENKAEWSHQLIAAAAAYEAQKAYGEHCEREGKPQSHEKAREIFAGFAGVAADRLIETKGADFIDREQAKHEAKKQAEQSFNYDAY
ncbi:hypothetical protein JCM8097_008566 [Rhodosporidiobolus ruineniae]